MELRQLTYVVAVADELNFTRAAERCHIAQSGLSAQVAKLERELGSPIFERTSRTVRLTSAGDAFVARVRIVLSDLERARAEVGEIGGRLSGVLRLGAMINHTTVGLAEVLAAFRVRYPAVDVTVLDAASLAMLQQVRAGSIDVAFVGLTPEQLPPGVEGVLVRTEPLVAIIDPANPCADCSSVGLAELARTTAFVECSADSGVRRQVDLAFARAGTTRRISVELGNVVEVAQLASLGSGAAIVPMHVAQALDPTGPLRVVPLTDQQAQQPVSLVVRPAGRRNDVTRAFVEQFTSTL